MEVFIMSKLKQILIVLVFSLVPVVTNASLGDSGNVLILAKVNEPLSAYKDYEIPTTVEQVAAIVAKKMGIEKYPTPVVKNMTQKEFDLHFFWDTYTHNKFKSTFAYFFPNEGVINWGPQFPVDRLAHEIVHYFQKFLGYEMESEDIYYEMEEQAASIQLWFRKNYSHGF